VGRSGRGTYEGLLAHLRCEVFWLDWDLDWTTSDFGYDENGLFVLFKNNKVFSS